MQTAGGLLEVKNKVNFWQNYKMYPMCSLSLRAATRQFRDVCNIQGTIFI